MRNPSAMARFRIRRVVTERWRARARILQIMKTFPGTPRRNTRPRMAAPAIAPPMLLMIVALAVDMFKDGLARATGIENGVRRKREEDKRSLLWFKATSAI